MNSSPQFRLHGYPVSNFFNIAHAALIEKKAAFEVVTQRAGQDPEFLRMSPMGKIPFLETPHGFIAETVAILEYLEDAIATPRLHPDGIFERARVRQIVNVVQMYIEAPVRTLYPGVFMGGLNTDTSVAAAKTLLERGMRALKYLLSPGEFLLGDRLTYADLYAFYCLDIAERVSQFVFRASVLAAVEGLPYWAEAMAKRGSSRLVLANFETAFAGYLTEKNAVYRPFLFKGRSDVPIAATDSSTNA